MGAGGGGAGRGDVTGYRYMFICTTLRYKPAFIATR